MNAGDFAVMVLAGGAGQLASALPYAIAAAAGVLVITGAGFLLLFPGCARLRRRRGGQCPCCTAEPYKVDDCTCREDCGAYWCQMADIDVPGWVNDRG